MPAPTVMTEETLNKLRTAFLIGCTDREACAYAEIAPSSLYEYQKDHAEYSEQKETWKQAPILKAKNTVVQSLTDPKNAQWYLERKRKDEFSLKQEIDQTNLNTEIKESANDTRPTSEKLADLLKRIKELREGE